MAKSKNQYIDNKKFFEEMVKYRQSRIDAEESGEERPVIPDYIGRCMMDISTRLSYKPNFINYPFREEMVADGIENAIRALNNFDPAKSANPFAYFTQIIYYAFLRRITKEKTLLYTKQKMYTSMAVMGALYDDASGTDLSNSQSSYATEYMNDFVTEYEKNLEKKKVPKVKKKSGIELFYDDEDEEEE
jgi:hypothetical protein|tara:strand:- start:1587 stop:2153 length:567 start_codon:yes stop_codon:yes gene_type:complete